MSATGLLPALYMNHPRPDIRALYPPRLRAYALKPPLVTQLPKDEAGSDTEASAFVTASPLRSGSSRLRRALSHRAHHEHCRPDTPAGRARPWAR